MFQTKVVQKSKTHILCSITFFRKSCRLWDNVEKYGTARQATNVNIIRRMRFACWITKATDTHSQYLILIGFPHQHWLRERASMLRNTYAACLVTSCTRLHDVRTRTDQKWMPSFWATNSANIMRLLTNMAGVFVVKAKDVVKKLARSGWHLLSYIDAQGAVTFFRIPITLGCF
jgi:hypothetical protein